MDEKSSWMRVAITVAVDWRFIVALVILVLALLLKEPNSREWLPPLPGPVDYSKFQDSRGV